MARLVTCGFEQRQLSAVVNECEGEGFRTVSGTPTISTSTKRSGGAALRCQTGQAAAWESYGGAVGDTIYARFYGYLASVAPSAATRLLFHTGVTSGGWSVWLQTNGTLGLREGSSSNSDPAIGSPSAALSAVGWVRLDVQFTIQSTGSGTISARVNGANFVTGAVASIGLGVPSQTGVGNSDGVTRDWFFDDVVINSSGGATPTGIPTGSRILLALPNNHNNINGFTLNAGDANWWDPVNQVPPVGAATPGSNTQIQSPNANATDHAQMEIDDYVTIGVLAGERILSVQGVAQVAVSDTTARTVGLQVYNNPVVAEGQFSSAAAAIGTSPTNWKTGKGTFSYLPTIATRSNEPWLRVWRRTATAGTLSVDLMATQVEVGDYDDPVAISISHTLSVSDSYTASAPGIGSISGISVDTVGRATLTFTKDVSDPGTTVKLFRSNDGTDFSEVTIPTPAAWQPSTAYAIGAIIRPTTPNGHYYRMAGYVPGASSSTEPTWLTTTGENADGVLRWHIYDPVTLTDNGTTITVRDNRPVNSIEGVPLGSLGYWKCKASRYGIGDAAFTNQLTATPAVDRDARELATWAVIHANMLVSTNLTGTVNTAAMPATVNVASTAGHPGAGVFTIVEGANRAVIAYTGMTATSFTGCTRQSGFSGSFSTSAVVRLRESQNKLAFAYPHRWMMSAARIAAHYPSKTVEALTDLDTWWTYVKTQIRSNGLFVAHGYPTYCYLGHTGEMLPYIVGIARLLREQLAGNTTALPSGLVGAPALGADIIAAANAMGVGFVDVLTQTAAYTSNHLAALDPYPSSTAAAWAASTTYAPGAVVRPSVDNGRTYKMVSYSTGTSGTVQPTFPNGEGSLTATIDGTCWWMECTTHAPKWVAATVYRLGQIVRPTTLNSRAYRCIVAGTSHASTQPTWPTTAGGEITDGTCRWEECTTTGAQNFYGIYDPITFAAVGGATGVSDELARVIAGFAALLNDPDATNFVTGGTKRAAGITILTDHIKVMGDWFFGNGANADGPAWQTDDTLYLAYTAHLLAVGKQEVAGSIAPASPYGRTLAAIVSRAADWFSAAYSTEPIIGNDGHPAAVATPYTGRAELGWRKAALATAGGADPLGDLIYSSAATLYQYWPGGTGLALNYYDNDDPNYLSSLGLPEAFGIIEVDGVSLPVTHGLAVSDSYASPNTDAVSLLVAVGLALSDSYTAGTSYSDAVSLAMSAGLVISESYSTPGSGTGPAIKSPTGILVLSAGGSVVAAPRSTYITVIQP